MPATLSRIADVFARLRSQQHMAFIPFVTAGDPDLSTTKAVIQQLSSQGADLIEVGFPYSDPIADGPVIQSSYTRALAKKVKLKEIFAAIGELKSTVSTPLLAMVSYALIFRAGPQAFVDSALAAGFSGLIVPDLPGDEAASFAAITSAAGLDLVQLVAPTTPADRIDRILEHGSGFVYCIAVAGTTGERRDLTAGLLRELALLRERTALPLCVGFGISQPDQIRELAGKAHGVIVGSAIVRQLEPLSDPAADRAAVLAKLRSYIDSMVAAAHSSSH